MALLLTLRGTPFMYYGEEIGMRDIKLRRREILDPPGKRYWPIYKGRDGCRAPMQWRCWSLCRLFQYQTMAAGSSGCAPTQCCRPAGRPGFTAQLHQETAPPAQGTSRPAQGRFHPSGESRGQLDLPSLHEEQNCVGGMNFTGHAVEFKLPEGKWELLMTSNKVQAGSHCSLAPNEVRLLIREK